MCVVFEYNYNTGIWSAERISASRWCAYWALTINDLSDRLIYVGF